MTIVSFKTLLINVILQDFKISFISDPILVEK
jgi:hypothetical protein